MRIGLDYRPALAVHSGIGVYVRSLVDALALQAPEDELELFGHRFRREEAIDAAKVPEGAHLHRRRVPAPVLGLAARAGLGADRLMGNVDVLHATDYAAFESSRAPLVATLHDVCFHTLPACYTPELRSKLVAVTNDIIARATRLIVPCERVRTELLKHTRADADVVRVVAHGACALPDVPAAEGLGSYVLFVGTLQPRKNLGRLLDAFARLRAQRPELQLVVVGGPGWDCAELLDRLGREVGVHYEGVVDRARIAALLGGARAFAYPSLGEGFGLPVLDGLVAGVPVLVGADTAAADLAGEAAVAVDPRDTEALAAGLDAVLYDESLRERIVAAGRARATQYTWARTAAATRAVYAEAVSS